MRPRIPMYRKLLQIPLKLPNSSSRLFTQNRFPPSRPQLPFLFPRQPRRPGRFISTETRTYLRETTIHTVKYGSYFLAFYCLFGVIIYGIQQEYFERNYPTPPEWSWITRRNFRNFRWAEDNDDPPKWYQTANIYRELVKRLEDPDIDGADLKEQGEGGIFVEGVGKTGFDITAKSAAWRQGYHAVLMAMARAAEYLDEWMVDETRDIAFPANTMIGPSNPRRRPIPPNSPPPPREENCKLACEAPEIYYMRILTTHGFTPKQRLDAALAYGAWLEYKKTPDAASEMYKWALDIALSSSPYADNPSQILDPETYVLKAELGSDTTTINSNIIRATTAIAVNYASSGSTSTALPIFLSILRARRSLPDEPKTMRSTLIPDEKETSGVIDRVRDFVEGRLRSILVAPAFPLDLDNGTEPPQRDPKGKCEEAALMTYIGEILYVSAPSGTSEKAALGAKEHGLAWTREAVDIAEEYLWGRLANSNDEKAKKVCTDCLRTGLDNWSQMISILVKEEKAKSEKAKQQPKGWLWGKNEVDMIGRWESEEAVVKERVRRAKEIWDKETERSNFPYEVNKEAFGGIFRGWLLP